MGGGFYSTNLAAERSVSKGYATKSTREIFSRKSINNAMNPYGIKVRESRDSEEHPESLSIILGLDVTGSMGTVPHELVKSGLPKIMGGIIEEGLKDPQLLFLGIGDHECDDAPLQVGQFESSDELLDKWLTDVYLEGGGGGNMGESYLLAWYFAARHTEIDCFEKRGKKGFLFTIGDEPTLPNISKKELEDLMGPGEYMDYTSDELLKLASEKYHVYHLHILETYSGSRERVKDGWKQLMGDNCIFIQGNEQVADVIKDVVTRHIDDDTPVSQLPSDEKVNEERIDKPQTYL